jgi:hypothetical protein
MSLRFGFAALAVSMWSCSAFAHECRLIEGRSTPGTIALEVTCGDGHPDAVDYGDGMLYLGVSLYDVHQSEPELLRYNLRHRDFGDALDLDPVEFKPKEGVSSFSFDYDKSGGQTHFLAAVWDRKDMCSTGGQGRCDSHGFTLGRVDSDELPLPVDAYPRPFCDIETMDEAGFFDKVRSGEIEFDINNQLPPELSDLFYANDCWSNDPDRLGLGYSVWTWRVAPVPAE